MKLLIALFMVGWSVSVVASEFPAPLSDTASTVSFDSSELSPVTRSKFGAGNLVVLSPQQWVELARSGIVADSLTAAGAAYDSVARQFVLILLNAEGRTELYPLVTPPSLYADIVERENVGLPDALPADSAVVLQKSIISSTALPQPPEQPGNQDGRTYFIVNTTLRATGIYPSSLALAMPGTDGRIITGVAMLTFGGALYGSYAATRTMPLGYGRVAMMNFGGELGVYYPALISFIADEQGYDETAQHLYSWGSMIGFPLGIVGASFTRFVDNHEYGNAAIMRHFGRVGLAYGFTIPLLWSFDNNFKNYRTVSSALAMAFIPAGFYLGKTIVGDRQFSSGRSGLVVIAGIMGAATGALIPSLWESKTQELYVGMGLAGSMAGTALGFLYHAPQEYKLWQGVFMGVSATVGAGVGVSIPLLAKAGDHQPYTVCGILGAWGGLVIGEHLSKALFENAPRDQRTSNRSFEFPLAWEWPSLACAALLKKGGSTDERTLGRACLVRISF